MAENKTNKVEREYTIPLRDKCRPVPRYKKTNKAVKTVKEFLVRHMKIRNRDLKKIKLDIYLNEALWFRGIKNPPHKIKVNAVTECDIVRVYAVDLPTKIDFKKKREDKRREAHKKAAEEIKESKKSMMDKAREGLQAKKEDKDKDKDGVEEKAPEGVPSKVEAEGKEKEKQKAVKETKEKEAKEDAKTLKKTTKEKTPEKKGKEEEVAKQ